MIGQNFGPVYIPILSYWNNPRPKRLGSVHHRNLSRPKSPSRNDPNCVICTATMLKLFGLVYCPILRLKKMFFFCANLRKIGSSPHSIKNVNKQIRFETGHNWVSGKYFAYMICTFPKIIGFFTFKLEWNTQIRILSVLLMNLLQPWTELKINSYSYKA